MAFSVEGGRRREKLAVGGSLPMGESMRWREKGKGAREQGEGGGGYPPTERGERRQPLPVAKDSRSLGAGLQREVGGPPQGHRRQSWAPVSCYPALEEDKRGLGERIKRKQLGGEDGGFHWAEATGLPGSHVED